jgi:hypothetical protein
LLRNLERGARVNAARLTRPSASSDFNGREARR